MTYTVKPGDTLSSIGARLGVDWRKITGFRSGNPNLIYPGEVLTIPDAGQPTTQQETQPTTQPQVSTADQIIQASIDSYTKLADEYQAKVKQFDANNPFNFDKLLEEETAKVSQRLDPYYVQTISDFLQGINTKRSRGVEDERTLLTELSQDVDDYTGSAKIALDSAVERSREGYADAGLYGSGSQLRDEGQAKAASERTVADYVRGAERQGSRIKTQTARSMEDLALDERLGKRDIEREKSYQISSQSLSETLRRQQQREYEKAQFTGLPPGANPSQFANYSYNLLNT